MGKASSPKPLSKPKQPSDGRAAMIDEYGRIGVLLQPYRSLVARHELLQKAIANWYDALPADQTFECQGIEYIASVSQRANKRTVFDIKELKHLLGKYWMSVVRVPLGDIDRHVPPTFHPQFMKEERTGNRSVQVSPKTHFDAMEKAA